MGLFQVLAILVTLTAIFSFLNYRYLRLPNTIGVMSIALVLSLIGLILGEFGLGIKPWATDFLGQIDFSQFLLHGMLSFLLFAGALSVNLGDLFQNRWVIGLLATGGVLLSTLVVGGLTYFILRWLGLDFSLLYCFVFGSLISPTDPVAVLGILRKVGVAKNLEIKITGESLFNDGVGVVVFLVLLGLAMGHEQVGVVSILSLFLFEAVGGAVFGFVIGWLVYRMLKQIDNYQVEILLTLALVTGGYSLAEVLHLSAPIAIVVSGLFIGNHGRLFAMSIKTREHLDEFWELIDEGMSAILFLLIGVELLVLPLEFAPIIAGIVIIPVVLFARWLSVGSIVELLRRRRKFNPHIVKIMTWGGLRGGISVALVLSLPEGSVRDTFLTITYIVVVFSILVQGLTIGPLCRVTKE